MKSQAARQLQGQRTVSVRFLTFGVVTPKRSPFLTSNHNRKVKKMKRRPSSKADRIRQVAMEVHVQSDAALISKFFREQGFSHVAGKQLAMGTSSVWVRK